jgi:uncharacterized membrane protein
MEEKKVREATLKKIRESSVFYLEEIKIVGAIVFFLIFSLGLSLVLKQIYIALDGADTLCHIYRGETLLSNILQGRWYPLYDSMWYNGVEIMRYWSPLPLYFLALVHGITGGNAIDAYGVFLGCLFFIGSCGWLCFGRRYNRIGLSVVLALVWFFCPENFRILTLDGNVPRMVINALLPFFCYTVWEYLEREQLRHLFYAFLLFLLMVLCHLGIALIVLSSILLLMIFHGISRKSFGPESLLILVFFLGFLVVGIWLVPAMHGGAVSNNTGNNQVMKLFFQNILLSLSPWKRMGGEMMVFYYGISLFFISIMGAVLSHKKTRIIFVAGLILFLCTGEAAYQVFSSLPFSQYLWMIRFVPLSIVFILMGFMLWSSLKKWLVVLLGVILLLDCYPSIQYLQKLSSERNGFTKSVMESHATREALPKAKALTKQRMAVMNLSRSSLASYYISGVEPKVRYVFGAGWEGAATATNMVQINTALELGHYAYLFDRLLELGSDVVVIPKDLLKWREYDLGRVKTAAKQSGYQFISETEGQLLFQYPVTGTFGTITRYENLSIGSSAKDIAMLFADFEEGDSICLEDYSLEKLLNYKKIYLSGFTYRNKGTAEDMIRQLAAKGVEVFIDMNRIPFDQETGTNQFLRVYAQTIVFEEKYPILTYQNKRYEAIDFADDMETWNTVYLDGVPNITGHSAFQNREVIFFGEDETGNIHFLGANLVYHALLTRDTGVVALLERLFGESYGTLPQRKTVPVTITYKPDKIVIETKGSSVNTALSHLDIFQASRPVGVKNHLIYVSAGKTELSITYPYFVNGIVVSCCGVLLSIIFFVYLFRKEHSKTVGYCREV